MAIAMGPMVATAICIADSVAVTDTDPVAVAPLEDKLYVVGMTKLLHTLKKIKIVISTL